MVGTFAIWNHESNFVSLVCGSSYSVNWGDGTTDNRPGNSAASKQYDPSVFQGLTQQDEFEGYKTVTITVTPQAGFSFTSLNLNRQHPLMLANANTPWLNIAIAGPTLNALQLSYDTSSTTNTRLRKLEKYEFVGTHNLTPANGLAYYFNNLVNLRSVVPPDLSRLTGSLLSCFNNCAALMKIGRLNCSSTSSANTMFSSCVSLVDIQELILPSTTDFTALGLFTSCTNLRRIPNINLSRCTSAATLFSGCRSLLKVPPLDVSRSTTLGNMFANCASLREVPPLNLASCTNTQSMFQGCLNLRRAPVFNTSRVTNMNSMFSTCSTLIEAPMMDTSKVTDMASMFTQCGALKNVPEYDTGAVTTMGSMFSSCFSLISIPAFNTSNVTTTNSMFSSCSALEHVPQLNTSKVALASSMFSSCTALTSIPYMDYKSMTDLNGMFSSCSSLTRISNFNINSDFSGGLLAYTSSAFASTFNGCESLEEIPEGNFFGTTGSANTNITINMFANCSSLKRIGATGFCHSFNISSTMMGPTQLNELYTNLAVVGASGAGAKTVTITSTWGRTADNPMIAISKGWAVSG
jgi:hypothetical protein